MIMAPNIAFGDLLSVDSEDEDLVGLGVAVLLFFAAGLGVVGGLNPSSSLTTSPSSSSSKDRLVGMMYTIGLKVSGEE
jgi:hypothetical protein